MPIKTKSKLILVSIAFALIVILALSSPLFQPQIQVCSDQLSRPVNTGSQATVQNFLGATIGLSSGEKTPPTQQVNMDNIMDIRLSSQNQLLIGTTQGEIITWNTDTNGTDEIADFDVVSSGRISGDGKSLLTFRDNVLSVWNIDTHDLEYSNNIEDVSTFAINADGALFAYGSLMQTITLVNPTDSSELWTISVYNLPLVITFNESEDLIAYGTHGDNDLLGDIVVGVINLNSPTNTIVFKGHDRSITSLDFQPEGTLLASGSRDTTVRLWDFCNRSMLYTLSDHHAEITSVAFSPDGQHLASADDKGDIKFWEISTGHAIATLSTGIPGIEEILFDNQGSFMAAYNESGAYLWRFASTS